MLKKFELNEETSNWKLADSEDPEDKVLYEYYSGAIYHPRTKPIIMEMYENP